MDNSSQSVKSKSLPPIDALLLENILKKTYNFPPDQDFKIITASIKRIKDLLSKNLDFFNNSEIFSDDLKKSIHRINTSLDCFTKSIQIKNTKANKYILKQTQKCFHLFSQFLLLFSDNISNINEEIKEKKSKNNLTQLGIESVLFNLAVTIKPSEQKPFYKSNILQAYGCYDLIKNLNENLVVFNSICGSGKTICLPLILITRILEKNVDSPFLIMTEPTSLISDSKTAYFQKKIGHYLTITNNLNELIEMYNNKQDKKLVFGILTPKEILCLIQKSSNFFKKTRIIFDEAHEQSLYTDVLLSMIKGKRQKLQMPIHFSMMSAIIERNHRYVKFFDNEIHFTQLVDKTLYKVKTKSIKSTKLQDYIDESIKIIDEMSKTNSSIKEGDIFCFLPANDACKAVINSISSLFNQSEETDETRKVVIMKTNLRPNESASRYYKRLRNEFDLMNGLNEAEENKNDILYFASLDLSENLSSSVYEIAQMDFPDDLKKINKLICSLPLNSPFATEKLSVVIDSGLSKVSIFNSKTGMIASNVIQSPQESMNKIKGLLGRTMKGLYVFSNAKSDNDEIPNEFDPSIVRGDLTNDILYLKHNNINFEKMKLPTKLNHENYEYSIQILQKINALDDSLKITKFGNEISQLQNIKNSTLSVFYAGAVLYYKDKYKSKNTKSAYFFAFYLATLISMATDLIQENMTEKLSNCFNNESDIVTLINASQILLSSDITNNDQLCNYVESYGFSYSNFLIFRNILKEASKFIFQKKVSISKKIDSFIKKGSDVSVMIDDFIEQIASLDSLWKKMHSIEYAYMKNILENTSRPILIFSGNKNLIQWPQHQKTNFSEVRVTRRPGWNGIQIPMKCYVLNLCIYLNHHLIYGNIIHRLNGKFKGELISIELPKVTISQWFNVLIETYFLQEKLNVKCFKETFYENNEKKIKTSLFNISNTGERVFLSFIPLDEKTKSKIQHGVDQCLKLMPFVPRSILIYRSGPKSLIEVTSIGTQDYDSYISSGVYGDILKRPYIDYCLRHLDELALSQPQVRICALFFNKECTINDFNQKRLYFVYTKNDEHFKELPNIIQLIEKHRIPRKVVREMKEQQNVILINKNHNSEPLGYFTFPPNFIHPALLFHQETHNCIMKWFSQCKYAKVKLAVKMHFLMTLKDIYKLKKHLQKDKEKIKKEMGLNYVAIPIPSNVYEKAHTTIREHHTWSYDPKFKVVITTIKESNEVHELVKKITDENKEANPSLEDNISDTLCCCYICDDPENPTLTNLPITIYYQDGSTYTNKMCRDCLALILQERTASFYNKGVINQDSLDLISAKPQPIPTVESKEINDGMESWPQIPLGQIISVIINNDDELSGLVSAWLNSVQEFTIRNLARGKFTFCPNHPKIIFRIKDVLDSPPIKCEVKSCKDEFCTSCMGWHPAKFMCEEKKTGKSFVWQKNCPKCGVPTSKNGGCNRICCPKCGCHWCYVCGKGFKTAPECYAHMKKIHGSSYADI